MNQPFRPTRCLTFWFGWILCLAPHSQAVASAPGALVLTYDRPAANWMEEGLPIGNGHMGAMFYGNAELERFQFNEESLWIGNEVDTGAYQNFGEVTVEFGPGSLVSNPSHNATSADQTVQASYDGDPGTKWCTENRGRFPILWQIDLPKAGVVSAYTITSAEDVPERDPSAWRFLGSQDGQNWTLLDEKKDVPIWPGRNLPKTFTFANQTAYGHYRFEFLAVHNAPHFQVAEIALGPSAELGGASPKAFHRELDLGTAIHRESYEMKGVKYSREAFASFPSKVIVERFTADKPGAISCVVSMEDAHGAPTVADGSGLRITGSFPGYRYGANQQWLPYHREAQLRVVATGGTLTPEDGKMKVEGADALVLYLDAGTDFKQDSSANWRGPLPHDAIETHLAAALKTPYADLRAAHVRDYQKLFDRVQLSLGGDQNVVTTTTGQRLRDYKGDSPDIGLEELLFQYGRYLLIASSREGGLPANLQGKWNNSNNPPWRCDYHTDINVEMNYWAADAGNLGECFIPFADWINSIRAPRIAATKEAFHVRGWTMRGESGLFGGSTWEWVPGSSAWLLQNLYDHYRYTGDKEYLRSLAYPAMKEVCDFWLDRLKPLPSGELVAPSGFSPEQGPVEDGVSFDQEVIWNLFTDTIEAADALGTDRELRDTLLKERAKLLVPKIGKWGQLQEWLVDRDDPKNTHRHLSHLFALYPGRQINLRGTPELAQAARVSLTARGDDSTGWGSVWRMCCWASLHDGDHAHKIFRALIRPCGGTAMANEGGGLYSNLLDACPPFQIDGNFGYTAAVCNMLLQSNTGEIEVLPALPKAWFAQGYFKGLRARGGFTVDCVWKNGQATSIALSGVPGSIAILRVGDGKSQVTIPASGTWHWRQ